MANVNSRKKEGPNVLILWNISFDPCLLLAEAWFCPENLPSPFPSPAGGEGIKETSPPLTPLSGVTGGDSGEGDIFSSHFAANIWQVWPLFKSSPTNLETKTSAPPYGLYRILIIPIFKLCLNLLYFGPERPCFLNQGNRVAVLFTPTRRLAP